MRYLVVLLICILCIFGQADKICLDRSVIQNLFIQLSALSHSTGKHAWPPTVPTFNTDASTHRIKLSLRPFVIPDQKLVNWRITWLHKLMRSYKGKRPTGSWFQKVITIQRKLGYKKTGKRELDYYPPMIDVKKIVKAMKSGHALPLKPVDDPDIELVRTPFTCGAKDHGMYDLIVMINAYVSLPAHRRWARQTFMKKKLWGSFKVGFFFLIGMPAPVNRRTVQFIGLKLRQPPSYPRGATNRATLTRQLLQEADKYNDMLIGDFVDEFSNQTLHIVMGYRWGSLFCSQRTSLFLTISSIFTLVPKNVVDYVKKIPKSSRSKFYGGRVYPRMKVFHASGTTSLKWAVSYGELPWTYYPPFSSRVATFTGSEILTDATIAMMYTRRYRFFDVYVGVVLRRLGKQPVHIGGLYFRRYARTALGAYTGYIIRRVNWNTGIPK